MILPVDSRPLRTLAAALVAGAALAGCALQPLQEPAGPQHVAAPAKPLVPPVIGWWQRPWISALVGHGPSVLALNV